MKTEIRIKNGKLDEVVGNAVSAHLEQMDSSHWYLEIDGIQIWLQSSRQITAYFEDNRGSRIAQRGNGFQAMSPEKLRAVSSKGGKTPHISRRRA